MKTTTLLAGIVVCALCSLGAVPAGDDPVMRTQHWQEDLDFFAREFPAKQKDFTLLVRPSDFETAVAELKRNVPQLSDPEIVLELTRIVAGLGVAHTDVAFGSASAVGAFHGYPIQMQWFSDGLAVVAATPEHREMLGCRVLRIGSMTPEQVEAAVAPYIAHENGAKLRLDSPRFMNVAELMQYKKIAGADGRLSLTLVGANGKEFTQEIKPGGRAGSGRGWVQATQAFQIPAGLARKHPEAAYWYEYLPDEQAFYIQYNKCINETNLPFAVFARALFSLADARPIQRVIVDLRFNSGGNSSIVQPLLDGLKARPALSARGHLYALVGARTFSSGVFATMDLRNNLGAVLVGEPAANKPNHYGEQKVLVLPNSKLLVHYSVKHFHLVANADPPAIEPDVVAAPTLNDFLAGRDRALDAALRHPLQ